jgi:prepilin-type processing-associated H-X9-DG protein
MTIPFTCPHCGWQTDVKDKFAGHSGNCRKCKEPIIVPGMKRRSCGVIMTNMAMIFGGVICCGLFFRAHTTPREAPRRMQCTNNIKQLCLAVHNYHDAYDAFPYAVGPLAPEQERETIDDAESITPEPQLWSWRVRLLPFMENERLYKEFRFDESWDSEHNLTVAETIPYVYQCPSEEGNDFEEIDGHKIPLSSYVMVSGPGAVGSTDGSEIQFKDMLDGTSNTLLIVEVTGDNRPPWTAPHDISVSDLGRGINAPFGKSIGSQHPGGANVGLCDGSVHFFSDMEDARMIRSMGNISDGGPENWY